MSFIDRECIATIRVTRADDGLYGAVIDFGAGEAPTAYEGHSTLRLLFERAAILVSESLHERDRAHQEHP